MAERCSIFVDQQACLTVAAVATSQIVDHARVAHGMGSTAVIALGRLLTATCLVSRIRRELGAMSIQLMTDGRLGQLFADINEAGDLRGYVSHPQISMPLLPHENLGGRCAIGHALRQGTVSMIRMGDDGEFSQSTTELSCGEVDSDIEHFLHHSDQVPSLLRCETLLNQNKQVTYSGGILVQLLPGGDPESLQAIRTQLETESFAARLTQAKGDVDDVVNQLLPQAAITPQSHPVRWQCRCSYARVLNAMQLFGAQELADMVDEKENNEVRCHFCNQLYVVPPEDIEQVFLSQITAKGQ